MTSCWNYCKSLFFKQALYVVGGKDEVLQYKKNGYEVGHLTRHLDGDGCLLQENPHGITSVPKHCKRV